jgi:hypothetical protein
MSLEQYISFELLGLRRGIEDHNALDRSKSSKLYMLVRRVKAILVYSTDHMECRYATAGTQVTTILITTAIVPIIVGWVTGYIIPAFNRLFNRAYTQEQLHEMHLNPQLHLGDAFAEVALVAMQERLSCHQVFQDLQLHL